MFALSNQEKEEKKLKFWLGPQNGSATFFPSAEIGKKKISFGTEVVVPNSVRSTKTGICGTVLEVIRYIETTAEITGGRWKVSWTRRTHTFKPELNTT